MALPVTDPFDADLCVAYTVRIVNILINFLSLCVQIAQVSGKFISVRHSYLFLYFKLHFSRFILQVYNDGDFDFWDVARTLVAVVWDAHGWIFHGK